MVPSPASTLGATLRRAGIGWREDGELEDAGSYSYRRRLFDALDTYTGTYGENSPVFVAMLNCAFANNKF